MQRYAEFLTNPSSSSKNVVLFILVQGLKNFGFTTLGLYLTLAAITHGSISGSYALTAAIVFSIAGIIWGVFMVLLQSRLKGRLHGES